MCEAAERDPQPECAFWVHGRNLNAGKTRQSSCTARVVTAGGVEGGDVLFCVQVIGGQSTTHAVGENPGSSPKPRGGSLEKWACQCSGTSAQPQCPGGVAGCTYRAASGSHARPGVCSPVHTPSTAACRMLPLLGPDRFWNEVSTTAPFSPSVCPGRSWWHQY